jgi:glycosyltransferase involved in cell wall biosynthesis
MSSLSVIIPIFNEDLTIQTIVERVRATGLADEILIVDDGSTDGTRELLEKMDGKKGVRVVLHAENRGKGAAVRTGLSKARGDILLIQDADLEYDPSDYPALLKPIEEGKADVVYGSRFLGGPRRVRMFWHMMANQLLTLTTNLLYNTILSDMETGYKVFRREALTGVLLRSNGFEIEPEITAKMLKRKRRIYEVPISFNPRGYAEGKKIRFKDAFAAMWALVKYRFVE